MNGRHLLASTLREAASSLHRESDRGVYAELLAQCIRSKAIVEGRLVHQLLKRSTEHSQDAYLKQLLVQMYAKCGHLEEATAVFKSIPQPLAGAWNAVISANAQAGDFQEANRLFESAPSRDVVSWTSLVSGYARHGHLAAARKFFDSMPAWNLISWNSMIAGYAESEDLEEARFLFDRLLARNAVSWTTLIAAYARKGLLSNAKLLFDRMEHRDVVAWTLMITAYGENGRPGDSKAVFERMSLWDVASWNAMLQVHVLNGYFEEARMLFQKMPLRGLITWNTMVQSFARSGDLRTARSLFDCMGQRNDITWNTMVQAYAQKGHLAEAREVLFRMPKQDVITWTSMIQLGSVEEAKDMFSRMQNPDVVAWNAMITAYNQNGHPREGLKLFREMTIEGTFPTDVTFSSILDACATLSALVEGKLIHKLIPESTLKSVVVRTALMNMYSKCGKLDEARSVFDGMLEQDQVCWNAMISAYARNGHGRKSLALFESMKQYGMDPDGATFMSVIGACSHAGLVKHGYGYFRSMRQDYGIEPDVEHFRAFLDLLGRSGKLQEAEDLINSMPFWPDGLAWTTLLGACKGHGDVVRAERIASMAFEMVPEEPLAYVLLSNTRKCNSEA